MRQTFLTRILHKFVVGSKKIYANPQLAYSLFVSIFVVVGFFVTAFVFIRITQDAQDRLITVRVGALHDGFSFFAAENIDEPQALRRAMARLALADATLRDLQVVTVDASGERMIIADLIEDENPVLEEQYNFAYDFSSGRPGDSFTFTIEYEGARQFITVRKLDEVQDVWFLTRQSLSEADRIVDQNILYAILMMLLIVIAILFLFLRQTKVVDYFHLYKKLQIKHKEKDSFISTAAHELRAPLAAIRGYAENLKDEKLSEKGKEHLGVVELKSGQLSDLIDDILDVARIQEGRLAINATSVKPMDVVDDVCNTLRVSAEQKGLELVCKEEGNVANVFVDEKRLQQILINLVGNAIKYTEKGTVTLSTKQQGGTVYFSVEDTGIGIGGEHQKHLFDKFYRVQSEKTSNIVGTGLGLWISKRIIELMGGAISVESLENVGTKFTIAFPVEE